MSGRCSSDESSGKANASKAESAGASDNVG